jgi:hypothetical protein
MKSSACDGFDLDFPGWIGETGDDKGAVSFI